VQLVGVLADARGDEDVDECVEDVYRQVRLVVALAVSVGSG
jgi:hypothetical protein